MSETVDDAIEEFIWNYFGNGSWQAPFWVIAKEPGMEKGDIEEAELAIAISNQLLVVSNNGLTDASEYQRIFQEKKRPAATQVTRISGNTTTRVQIQPTWGVWIKIMIAAGGLQNDSTDPDDVEITREKVRDYQSSHFLRDGICCWIDYLPLPSKKNKDWIYGCCSGLDWLTTRELYQQHVSAKRINAIKAKLARHRPKSVVFFLPSAIAKCIASNVAWQSESYRYLGADPKDRTKRKEKEIGYEYATSEHTIYHILPPPSHVNNNGFSQNVGNEIRDFMKKRRL